MINFIHVHTCLETCGAKREQKIHTNLPTEDSTTVFSMKCGVPKLYLYNLVNERNFLTQLLLHVQFVFQDHDDCKMISH